MFGIEPFSLGRRGRAGLSTALRLMAGLNNQIPQPGENLAAVAFLSAMDFAYQM